MNQANIYKVLASILIMALFSCLGVYAERGDKKDRKDNPLLKQKSIAAVKTELAPHIDGKLDDSVWLSADIADQFIQYSPYNGSPSKYRTEVRVLYDNSSI